MFTPWWLALAAFAYIGVLFVVASLGDRPGRRRLVTGPWVYSLSMAVYCTAWTFYGSVGRAASTGLGFLPIYLGPTLAMALGWVLLRKIVRIAKRHRITSIADLVAARYGKSRGLGALVTLVVVFGSVPYLALQLKAVAATFLLLAEGGDAGDPSSLLRASFVVATVLAVFAILFGTRHLDLTEQHGGLVLAIAFEAIVKLVAFLAVGLWVVFHLHDGPADLFGEAIRRPELVRLFSIDMSWSTWAWMTVLAGSAILFLPRQFQVAVVECTDEGHLRRAAWVLPLYLLAINLFVLPIAVAGRLRFDGGGTAVDADTFVLSLPLAEGQAALALLVFIGGLSAATGMVIVECVALSTMVANDLVLPFVLRPALGDEEADLGGRLVTIRRLAIVGVLLLGQLYLTVVGTETSLVAIGLVSFAAVAQLAPSILGGLYWQGATARGAAAGLVGGFAVWAYTLPLPTLMASGHLPGSWLTEGPLGLAWLRPQALFGLTGLDPIGHAMLWSMAFNVGLFVIGSAWAEPGALELRQARRFVEVFRVGIASEPPQWRIDTPVASVRSLLNRFLGAERTQKALDGHFQDRGLDPERVQRGDAELMTFAEQLLAGSTGAASAHIALRSVAEEHPLDAEEVMSLLDETSRVLATSRELADKSRQLERASDELRQANERLRELDRLKDDFLATMTHELRTPLTSIRAFTEILHDRPHLPEAKRREFLAIVLKENERLSRLIGQVLDLGKIESEPLSDFTDESPAGLVRDAVATFGGRFEGGGDIEIEQVVADDLPPVRVDRDRMLQVLVNLLSNALDALGDRGRIRVAARLLPEGGRPRLELAVDDDGPGVPEADRETIFDKFRQARGASHGTGLGLAICRGIIQQHGGVIRVETSPLGGARFAFTLPAADRALSELRTQGGAPRF